MALVYAWGNLGSDRRISLPLASVPEASAEGPTDGESVEVALKDDALGGFDRSKARAPLADVQVGSLHRGAGRRL